MVTRLNTKEVLVFLSFTTLSALFWLVSVSQEEFETTLRVPLVVKNIPDSTMLTSDLPEYLQVVVKDKGFDLINVGGARRYLPVVIDYNDYTIQQGAFNVTSATLHEAVKKTLLASHQIVSMSPSTMRIHVSNAEARTLDVVLQATFSPASNCILTGAITYSPATIQVVAPPHLLEGVTSINTRYTRIVDLTDTLEMSLGLEPIEGVKFLTKEIQVTVPVEEFTEKTIDVPIRAVGLPSRLQLRTFPARATIVCNVGLSNFPHLTDTAIFVGVDYAKRRAQNPADKLAVDLIRIPPYVRNVRLFPDSVEYIIEEILSYD